MRLSAVTVPPQARCASFIPRPAHRGKDPSLEEAFFDLTRNETDCHAGPAIDFYNNSGGNIQILADVQGYGVPG